MWDQQQYQYQSFLTWVRTYYPNYLHLLPTSLPAQSPQTAQSGGVQEIQFLTKAQIEAYIPTSYKPVALWDQDSNLIYLVRLDGPGQVVRETLKWERCAPPQENAGGAAQYATAEDFSAMQKQLAQLTQIVASLPEMQKHTAQQEEAHAE